MPLRTVFAETVTYVTGFGKTHQLCTSRKHTQLNNLKRTYVRNISRRSKAAGLQFATYVAIAIQGL